jgi:hypothetical protein
MLQPFYSCNILHVMPFFTISVSYFCINTFLSTVELQLFGLIGMARQPDVQKIRIIGFFFCKIYLIAFWSGKGFYKQLFWVKYLDTYK